MTIVLLVGMILTAVLIIKRKEFSSSSILTSISYKMRDSFIGRNYWGAGAVLFLANALLFALALLMMFFIMPFGMVMVLLVCIPLSIFVWFVFSESWQGAYKDKIKMAVIGCSFFVAFMGWVIWQYTTLEPAYPGDDLFMAWIGVLIALTGSLGALSVSLFVILKN